MNPELHDAADIDGSDLARAMLPAFIAEVSEQLATFEELLLQLESAPEDLELLDGLFRCAHTVKGSAGLFGLERVAEFTHHVETLLDRLREGRLGFTSGLGTLLLCCNDMIRELVRMADAEETDEELTRRCELVVRLKACSAGDDRARPPVEAPTPLPDTLPAPGGAGCWHLSVRFDAGIFRHGLDPATVLEYAADLGAICHMVCDASAVPPLAALDPQNCHLAVAFDLEGDVTRAQIEDAFDFVREDCTLQIEARTMPSPVVGTPATPVVAPEPAQRETEALVTPAAAPRAVSGAGAASARGGMDEGGFIRVQASRLDDVINLLGELVIAGAGASQLAQQTRERGLIEANRRVSRLIEGIRNSTLKLRMVPIGETFARFRRVVRDIAGDLDKDVVLEIEGGDTELDKAVIERIADSLVHLVRNALDHGLESPAERAAAGKPLQGRLTLSACHEAGSILLRIQDDGRDIQRDKVLERAWQRGLVEPGVVPPDDEVLRLIFEPGFSTAETVTNLSGRGVGMDVVRSNIEALRGSIHLTSEPGQGSCIEIRLPLTLAIIDGFLVGVGATRFILPLETVLEVLACRRMAEPVTDALGRGCIELRGRQLPVLDLRRLYRLDAGGAVAHERRSIVVVQAGVRRFGVMVDQLLGQHQTVIKPLSRLMRGLKGISGSSILGSGEVTLIVDAEALGQMACSTRAVEPAAGRSDGAH